MNDFNHPKPYLKKGWLWDGIIILPGVYSETACWQATIIKLVENLIFIHQLYFYTYFYTLVVQCLDGWCVSQSTDWCTTATLHQFLIISTIILYLLICKVLNCDISAATGTESEDVPWVQWVQVPSESNTILNQSPDKISCLKGVIFCLYFGVITACPENFAFIYYHIHIIFIFIFISHN